VKFGAFYLKLSALDKGMDDKEKTARSMKELENLRKAIVARLRERSEISEVQDLFEAGVGIGDSIINSYTLSSDFEEASFPPIIAVLQLPARLQHIELGLLAGTGARVSEKFVILLDGESMFISAPARTPEMVLGFADARDKIKEILGDVTKFETVAPTPSRVALRLVNGTQEGSQITQSEATLRLDRVTKLKDAIQLVYVGLKSTVDDFYSLLKQVNKEDRVVSAITDDGAKLLAAITDLHTTQLYHFLKRRSTMKEMRSRITAILGSLSLYSSVMQQISEDRNRLVRDLKDDELVRDLLEKNEWEREARTAKVDSQSALAIVEHARSEIELSGIVSITIWAALAGAIIGSLLTFLVSKLI
jgi:hypothetical protein